MSQPSGRVLRLPETERKLGLKRDAIYRGGREGWLPKPIRIGPRATGWLESELDQFIAARAAER